jgi:ABC-type antimicrobial peptide transport system ATPase subunit
MLPPDAIGEVEGVVCESGTTKSAQVLAACAIAGNSRHKDNNNIRAYDELKKYEQRAAVRDKNGR